MREVGVIKNKKMNKEIDKIGDLFRNTLKDHHMESDSHLWDRLESQLSAQPSVSVPKTSGIRHLTWVKVAVAASFIVSVALAFNYIYLPLKNANTILDTKITNHKTDAVKPVESVIDSTITEKVPPIQPINPLERENQVKNNAANQKSSQKQIINPLLDPSTGKNVTSNIKVQSNYSNSGQTVNQTKSPVVNSQKNPVNSNISKIDPAKDSISKPGIYQVNDSNPLDIDQHYYANQNTPENKDLYENLDVINDLDIPNIFTPNNDGVNDYFVIRNIEKCSNNHLVIKNRNGNTVFERNNYQNDWDGRNLTDGVYFFFLKYKVSGNNFGKYGSITIKR